MKYCPKTFLAGESLEDREPTGPIPLPDPVDFDPALAVHLSCGPCGKEWAIPAGAIMKGKVKDHHMCPVNECQAKVMLPAPVEVTVEVPGPERIVEKEVLVDKALPEGAIIVQAADVNGLEDQIAELTAERNSLSEELSKANTPRATTTKPKRG